MAGRIAFKKAMEVAKPTLLEPIMSVEITVPDEFAGTIMDGKPMRHATWAECERRVKGRSGARFKKATSAADEVAILRAWGVAPEDV